MVWSFYATTVTETFTAIIGSDDNNNSEQQQPPQKTVTTYLSD